MKNKLSFEIIKIIIIGFLITVSINLSVNFVRIIYFDKTTFYKKSELQNKFDKEDKFDREFFDNLDHLDDTEDFIELIINVLSIVIFSSIVYLGINKKVKYITDISYDISYIGDGDLNYKIPVKGKNEIADLAMNINNMTGALKSHIEKEQKTLQAEQQLITGLSHDIRTPLSTIIGYLYVIKDKQYKSDQERDKYVEILLEKSIRLQKLFDNLLEISKLQEGKMEMNTTNITVEGFVEHYLIFAKDEIERYGFEVNLNDISKYICSIQQLSINTMYTFRVIENLVSNIIKYAVPKSRITIEFSNQEQYFEVRISNKCDFETCENTNRLTERFFKVDQSRMELESSGLGLSICTEIMKNQKGYIEIEGNKETNILTAILGFKKLSK